MSMIRPMIRPMVRPMVSKMLNNDPLAHYLSLVGAKSKLPVGSAFTNGSTTTATAIDFEGKVWGTLAGEIRYSGGRRVYNLAANPSAPATQSITVVSGVEYCVSITGAAGSTAVLSNAAVQTLTNDGTNRISHNSGTPITAGSTTLTITITGAVATLQVEQVSSQAVKTPSEFVSNLVHNSGIASVKYFDYKNATTVSAGGVVTEVRGAVISPAPSILHEPAATNSILHSSNMTNAAWTKLGTAVAALDAIGMNFLPNSASTLTDDDGAAYEWVRETVTIPNDASTHVLRVFVKKDSTQTRFPYIWLKLSGGTTVDSATELNTTTGATGGATGTYKVNSYGIWWEVLASCTNNTTGNVSAFADIYPAISTSIGTQSVAATGSIIVGNVEVHLNKTIAEVQGLAPIFTTTAAVTRNVDLLQISDVANWWKQSEGVLLFKNTFGHDSVVEAGHRGLVAVAGNSAGSLFLHAGMSGRTASYDFTNLTYVDATFATGTTRIAAVIWSTPLNKISISISDDNGATWTSWSESAYDNAFTLGTKLNLFWGNPHINNLKAIRLYKYLPKATLANTQTYIQANAATLLS